jgi:hypothetical protein
LNHRIQISASGPERYRVSGAVDLFGTGTPIPDAARALIAAGAEPSDTLSIASQDATFAPMPLARFAVHYKPPRKSDLAAAPTRL